MAVGSFAFMERIFAAIEGEDAMDSVVALECALAAVISKRPSPASRQDLFAVASSWRTLPSQPRPSKRIRALAASREDPLLRETRVSIWSRQVRDTALVLFLYALFEFVADQAPPREFSLTVFSLIASVSIIWFATGLRQIAPDYALFVGGCWASSSRSLALECGSKRLPRASAFLASSIDRASNLSCAPYRSRSSTWSIHPAFHTHVSKSS